MTRRATGDDDDVGDDDDSGDDDDGTFSGPVGACSFLSNGTLVACAPSQEKPCLPDEGPKGTTAQWADEECPTGFTASCTADKPGDPNWFFYADANHPVHEEWCEQCTFDIDPANFCE